MAEQHNQVVLKAPNGIALFEQCVAKHDSNNDQVLLCMADGLALQQYEQEKLTRSYLLVLCGAMVFFMQLGFAMLCAGCVRRKNVFNTLLKNLLDACGAAISFYAIGYAFAFGGDDRSKGPTFVGTDNFFLMGDVDFGVWFYHYTFSAAAVTIIAGTLAERCRMSAYCCYSLIMTGFVYPVAAHSIWSENGFLSAFAGRPFAGAGALDFAGSGVVHMTGGATALIATWILGARKGRFINARGEMLDKPKDIPGHSISLQVMGCLMLWFGWYGFNSGSALINPNATDIGTLASLAAVNSSLAAAAGGITALLTHMAIQYRITGLFQFDLTSTVNGILTGVVSVTAGAGLVEPWAAALIGMIGGWVFMGASELLLRFRLDDAVNGIPVHLAGGAWGLIAVGFVASPGRLQSAYGRVDHVGFFYSLTRQGGADFTLLGNQILALIFLLGWCTTMMLPFFFLLDYLGWLRVDEMEEIAGLDARYIDNKQEDHEQVREQIIKEFRSHKEDQQQAQYEARTHHVGLTSTSNSGGNSRSTPSV